MLQREPFPSGEAECRRTPEALCAEGDALYGARRQLDRAFGLYEEAWRLGADPLAVAHNQWMCAMLTGDFAAAWRLGDRVIAERRRRGMTCAHLPYHERWAWNGDPLDGRRVLIRCYHGLGDAIQFLRLAAPLRRSARRITVQAVPALLGIAGRMEGIDEVVSLDEKSVPLHDVEIEASELPHALRLTLAGIPNRVPYISLSGASAAQRRRRSGAPGPLRVGVVWAAGGWRPERSIPLARFRPVLRVDGIRFVNLQRGPGLAELRHVRGLPAMTEWGEGTTDLVRTAETLLSLDLVISVDTMIAHLAGALAVPVWTLLHWHSDWRWLLQGSRTPWYPTMRLFRQPSPGAWQEVVDEVAAALRAKVRLQAHGPAEGGRQDALRPSTNR